MVLRKHLCSLLTLKVRSTTRRPFNTYLVCACLAFATIASGCATTSVHGILGGRTFRAASAVAEPIPGEKRLGVMLTEYEDTGYILSSKLLEDGDPLVALELPAAEGTWDITGSPRQSTVTVRYLRNYWTVPATHEAAGIVHASSGTVRVTNFDEDRIVLEFDAAFPDSSRLQGRVAAPIQR